MSWAVGAASLHPSSTFTPVSEQCHGASRLNLERVGHLWPWYLIPTDTLHSRRLTWSAPHNPSTWKPVKLHPDHHTLQQYRTLRHSEADINYSRRTAWRPHCCIQLKPKPTHPIQMTPWSPPAGGNLSLQCYSIKLEETDILPDTDINIRI